MPKHYDIKVEEMYGKSYVKVYVKDIDRIDEFQNLIGSLTSVAKVNITESRSQYGPSQNLTVYPSRVYDIGEVFEEVKVFLDSYFEGTIIDPQFNDEIISHISDKAYGQILKHILTLGKNLEKLKGMFSNLNEEQYRDYFLPFLNSISNRHSASGETYNNKGRTDILIQDCDGNNVFIAECKIWYGSAKLSDAIDQLLERYVNWRDEKVAVIVFNKEAQNFSDIIQKATQAVETHRYCKMPIGKGKDTSFSYIFQHPDDAKKQIKLELILFNFS